MPIEVRRGLSSSEINDARLNLDDQYASEALETAESSGAINHTDRVYAQELSSTYVISAAPYKHGAPRELKSTFVRVFAHTVLTNYSEPKPACKIAAEYLFWTKG